MRGLTLALFVGCAHVTPPAPPPPIVVTRAGCLPRRPPRAVSVTRVEPCPAAVCYDEQAARALLDELEDRRRWDAAAVAACGLQP